MGESSEGEGAAAGSPEVLRWHWQVGAGIVDLMVYGRTVHQSWLKSGAEVKNVHFVEREPDLDFRVHIWPVFGRWYRHVVGWLLVQLPQQKKIWLLSAPRATPMFALMSCFQPVLKSFDVQLVPRPLTESFSRSSRLKLRVVNRSHPFASVAAGLSLEKK